MKTFSMISQQRNANQNHKPCHFSSVRIALIKEQKTARADENREKSASSHHVREGEMVRLPWKGIGQFLRRHHHSTDPIPYPVCRKSENPRPHKTP